MNMKEIFKILCVDPKVAGSGVYAAQIGRDIFLNNESVED